MVIPNKQITGAATVLHNRYKINGALKNNEILKIEDYFDLKYTCIATTTLYCPHKNNETCTADAHYIPKNIKIT